MRFFILVSAMIMAMSINPEQIIEPDVATKLFGFCVLGLAMDIIELATKK